MATIRQAMCHLAFLGYYSGDITTERNDAFSAALKRYKRDHSLAIDSTLDDKTGRDLQANYDYAWKHNTIAMLSQRILRGLGFYLGPLNGDFSEGSNAFNALTNYQKSEGLKTDGITGSGTLTWSHLKSSWSNLYLNKQQTEAQKILTVAKKEVGASSGKKYWEWYMGTTYVNGTKTPYCGCFVAWVMKQAGVKTFDGVTNKASVGSWYDWAVKNKRWKIGSPKAGDLVIFDFPNNSTTYDHIGIVFAPMIGGGVTTIEGNTSNVGLGTGGYVMMKNRKTSIKGYVSL